jgi:hypothetical protein
MGILLNRKEKENETRRWAGIRPAAFDLMGQRPTLPMGSRSQADPPGLVSPSTGQPNDAGARRARAQHAVTTRCVAKEGFHGGRGRRRFSRQLWPKKVFAATVVEEGFRGSHQCSEETASGKARAVGAHSRWPTRVRGGAGPSGCHSSAVRGSGEPLAALGGPGGD